MECNALKGALERLGEIRIAVDDLFGEVSSHKQVLETYENDVEALGLDRLRLLESMGLTEHEWACEGGRRFSDIPRLDALYLKPRDGLNEKWTVRDRLKELRLVFDDLSDYFLACDQAVFDYETEVKVLCSDRLLILESLRLTEHEWACAGGQRFGDLPRLQEFFEPDRQLRFEILDEVVKEIPEEPDVVAPEPAPVLVSDVAIVAPKSAPAPVATLFELVAASSPAPATRLFEIAAVSRPSFSWTREQFRALADIRTWYEESSEPFWALTGPAGVGKSTLVREIVTEYSEAALAALTGKAALRLGQCSERTATTLHSILYWPPLPGVDVRFTRLREPPSDFVIVDECSMITPAIFEHLKQWSKQGVRFLLIGDDYQLPPVITGEEAEKYGEDYSVFSSVPGSRLQTVIRNEGGVLRAATHIRQTGEPYLVSEDGYEFARPQDAITYAVREYLADLDDHLLVTWKNASRMAANRLIRHKLGRCGPLPDEGEPVLIRKNGQGFLNGEVVPCWLLEEGPTVGSIECLWMTNGDRRVLVSVTGGDRARGGEFFDGGMPVIENWRKYRADLKKQGLPEPLPLTWGYCLTGHAVQGSEGRRVTVFLDPSDLMNKHFRKPTTLPTGEQVSFAARWLYTATTRGKTRSTLAIGR